MRIGTTIKNEDGHPLKEGDTPKEFQHLLIESLEDLLLYANHYGEIASHKAVNALFGFRSQNFRSSLLDYLTHEEPSIDATVKALAFKVELKKTNTSITEYCEINDSLIRNKINSMQKLLLQGKTVRVNNVGGYSYLHDSDHYNYYTDINEKQLSTFINTGKIEDSWEITHENIIIENSPKPPADFIEKVESITGKGNFQAIGDFKLRTTGWTKNDFIKLLRTGKKNGLTSIFFETTGQDFHFIQKMHNLVKEFNIKIYFSTYHSDTKKLFSDIGTLLP